MPKPMRYGELFAGVGGFSIGFEKAGWECLFQVEWDPNCQQTLAAHWPDVKQYGDVSEVSGYELPPVDLISFGSPCQDLSVAGRRTGLDGSRSVLFYEATRIIKEMREATNGEYPKWAIWENVAGAFSSSGGEDFEAVLTEMGDIGSHHIEWHCLDAQFFGVPQRRRRVFLISCFSPAILERGGQEILPVGQGRRRNSAKGSKQGQDPSSEIAGCLRSGGSGGVPSSRGEHLVIDSVDRQSYGNSGFSNWREQEQTVTLTARDHKSPNTVILEEAGHLMIDGRRTNDVRLYVEPVQTLEARMGTGGNNVPVIAKTIGFSHTQGLDPQPSTVAMPTLRANGSGAAVAYDEYNDRLVGDVHHTLRAGTRQSTGVLDGMQVRRLTPIECERLMGWPDNHTLYRADGKTNSDSTRYKMCGNGVASTVVEWIALHIDQVNLQLIHQKHRSKTGEEL